MLRKQLKEEVRVHEESEKFLQNQQEVTLILTSVSGIICCVIVALGGCGSVISLDAAQSLRGHLNLTAISSQASV